MAEDDELAMFGGQTRVLSRKSLSRGGGPPGSSLYTPPNSRPPSVFNGGNHYNTHADQDRYSPRFTYSFPSPTNNFEPHGLTMHPTRSSPAVSEASWASGAPSNSAARQYYPSPSTSVAVPYYAQSQEQRPHTSDGIEYQNSALYERRLTPETEDIGIGLASRGGVDEQWTGFLQSTGMF